MIRKCPTCKPHEYQDGMYGDKMRVQNPVKTPTDQPPKYRCTVCGVVR